MLTAGRRTSLFMKTLSSLECLEPRIAPAGVVTIDSYDPVKGTLSISGDDADNHITFFQTAPGHFRLAAVEVSGVSSTVINSGDLQGVAFVDLTGKLRDVLVNLAGGNDGLRLQDLPGLRSLLVLMGGGDDGLRLEKVATTGAAMLDLGSGMDTFALSGASVRVGGDLTIEDGGDGMKGLIDTLDLAIKGQLIVAGNSGPDVISSPVTSQSAPGQISVGKGINFSGGGGLDVFSLTIGTLTVGKTADGLSLQATGGADPLSISLDAQRATFAGSIDFTGGASTDRLDLVGLPLSVGRNSLGESIAFDGGGGGADVLAIDGSVKLQGGIDATGGGHLAVSAGHPSAPNSLSFGKLKSGHSVSIDSSAPVGLLLSGTPLSLAGGLSVHTAGDALLQLTGATLSVGQSPGGQSIEVQSGGAVDLLFLSAQTVFQGGVKITAGQGLSAEVEATKLSLGKTSAGDSLLLSAGNSTTNVLKMNIDTLTATGALSYLGSSGVDTITLALGRLSAPRLGVVAGDGGNTVLIQVDQMNLGAFSYVGGSEDDTLTVHASGSIRGDVTVELGDAFDNNAATFAPLTAGAPELKIGGLFKVTSTSGGVVGDFLTIDRLSVAKNFEAIMGKRSSQVAIDGLTVKGTTSIDTGAGNDTVEIERASTFLNSSFAKGFTLNLGDGNDTLHIGNNASPLINMTNRVHFGGFVSLDGATGTDTRNADLQAANSLFDNFSFPGLEATD